MQPYLNYSWPNNYNPYLQPTQMSASNYQQPQIQQQNVTCMNGRFVNDMNEITANDVPMTGSYAIFPKNDMSEIYAKAWNANGQITTMTYKLSKPEEPKQVEHAQVDLTEVNDRLDRIEKILAARSTKTRKEANADD